MGAAASIPKTVPRSTPGSPPLVTVNGTLGTDNSARVRELEQNIRMLQQQVQAKKSERKQIDRSDELKRAQQQLNTQKACDRESVSIESELDELRDAEMDTSTQYDTRQYETEIKVPIPCSPPSSLKLHPDDGPQLFPASILVDTASAAQQHDNPAIGTCKRKQDDTLVQHAVESSGTPQEAGKEFHYSLASSSQNEGRTEQKDKAPALPKVLVVDDSSTILKMVSKQLRKRGFYVELACDGEEGLRMLKSRHRQYSFVLSDLEMPHKTGPQMVADFRAWEARHQGNECGRPSRLFICSMSSNEEKQDALRQESVSSNSHNMFISKPVTKEKLNGVLEMVHGAHNDELAQFIITTVV